MATITIGHHPELTGKDVVSIFEKHFADKYEIDHPHTEAAHDGPDCQEECVDGCGRAPEAGAEQDQADILWVRGLPLGACPAAV